MEEHTGDRDHGAGHYGGGSDAPQWASRERNSEGRAGRHVASGTRRDRKMYQPGDARPDVIDGLESVATDAVERPLRVRASRMENGDSKPRAKVASIWRTSAPSQGRVFPAADRGRQSQPPDFLVVDRGRLEGVCEEMMRIGLRRPPRRWRGLAVAFVVTILGGGCAPLRTVCAPGTWAPTTAEVTWSAGPHGTGSVPAMSCEAAPK